MRHQSPDGRRPATTMVEFAIVAMILFLLTVGTIVLALGVHSYFKLAFVAREATRYAAVRGADYATDTGKTATTPQDVYNSAILPAAQGLDLNRLSYTVTWDKNNYQAYADTTSDPPGKPVGNKVIVTVTYDWLPQVFFGGATMTSRAEMSMEY